METKIKYIFIKNQKQIIKYIFITLETTDIQETPIETIETPIETPETPIDTIDNPIETPIETIKTPKKNGRPLGSKNKTPFKPRPRKQKVIEEPIEHVSEEELGQSDPQQRLLPTEPHNALADAMLRLLNSHQMDRIRRKDAQRRSWFA